MTAAARHPQDWYVEQSWTSRALMQMVPFDRDYAVWDPCCGLGTIPAAFAEAGYQAVGTDLVDRWSAQTLGLPHLFLGEHDFLGSQVHMMERWPLLSIVFNPPYGCDDDIAERCIRRALSLASGKVCALLPIRWRAAEKRFDFLDREYRPLAILEFCDRPSMPPGTALHQRDDRGQPTAWRRGTIDYAWYVWDRHYPRPDTVSRLIPPRSAEQKRIDRDADLRRVGVLPPLQLEIAA